MPRHSSHHSSTRDEDRDDRRVRLRAKVFTDLSRLLPSIGLIFIALGLVQMFFCLVPMNFLDPRWEAWLVEQLVMLTWLPLLGLSLILLPFAQSCTFWHLRVRGAVTWIALALGVGTLLGLPFGITATIRAQNALSQPASLATAPVVVIEGEEVDAGAIAVVSHVPQAPGRSNLSDEERRMATIELWGTATKTVLLGLLSGAGFLLLFFKTGVYRYLLHQDAIGKGEHVGITRDPVTDDDILD